MMNNATLVYIVSVLWREEGYTVKYSLSTREIPRAELEGFPKGSGYILYVYPGLSQDTDILNF